MDPYYQDGHVTIYHGDSREILPHLTFDVIVTDPPYGIGVQTNYGASQRSGLARANDYGGAIVGDADPFDPTWLLAYPRLVLFGANHYADRLPPSASWIVWDKLDGLESDREIGFNDSADVEMAWTNMGGPARLIRHRWMGLMKGSEHGCARVHPTQKPVALMTQVVRFASRGGDVVVADPYMGSGSTLRAAKDLGLRAIGIEIEERYCEVAAQRCAQEVLDLGILP